MAVGSTYPSIEEFKYLSMLSNMSLNTKLTIVHHIGLGDIVQEKVKDNCPWRIHASVKEDQCTVVVFFNSTLVLIFLEDQFLSLTHLPMVVMCR
jgi:hypothetical protein